MGSVSRYAYINARLHALIGSLVDDGLFQKIERAPSLEESLYYFTPTVYNFVQGTYSRTGDLKSVEKALITFLYEHIESLRRHAPGELGGLIDVLSGRLRFDAFKTLLRLWYDQSVRGRSIADYTEYIPREIPLEGLSHDALVNAPDAAALGALLVHTPYRVILPGLEDIGHSGTIAAAELDLEKEYYRGLVEAASAFHGEDGLRVQRLIHGDIDEINLGRLLRIAAAFDDENRLRELYVPGGRRVMQRDFVRFMKTSDRAAVIDEVLARFGITASLAKMDKTIEYTKILTRIAFTLDEEKRRLCIHTKVRSLFDAGLLLAYVRLREREIQRIIRALNARYYGKDHTGGTQ